MIERHEPQVPAEQPTQLLYAPPSYGQFDDADLVRFRLLINPRGWTVGLVWVTTPTHSSPAKAGITWNSSSKLRNSILDYLSKCAHEGIDASAAFDAVVAETPGASWSEEFVGFGLVDEARIWMQGFSDDQDWAQGKVLPPRTTHWHWADPDEFEFFIATHPETQEHVLLASGPRMLLRNEGEWWVVPAGDRSISGSTIIEVRPGLHELVDKYGSELLEQPSILSAFRVS